MSIRVAFIGAGQMARHHLQVIKRLNPPAVVVGVHDRAPEQAQDFASLAPTRSFASVEALLGDARPDVVHVCTPPFAHVEAARAALEAGAHVYVEKPFALTAGEARLLLELAERRQRLVCAGHQLLCDPAFRVLMTRAAELGPLVKVDSHFAFRPVGPAARGSRQALVHQLIDILPHPLYSLVAALEQTSETPQPITLAWANASPTDVNAVLRAGEVTGRLSVSLRARPVASALTLDGTRGSLTCDFVRTTIHGLANPGTEALEKIVNPIAAGAQLITRTSMSLARRLKGSGSYPGLFELIDAFYRAIATGSPSPVSPEHLLLVAGLFEELVGRISEAPRPQSVVPGVRMDTLDRAAPVTVLTGANGLLGSAIARVVPRVRGIARTPKPDDHGAQDWVMADLKDGVPVRAFERATVVIHAAAETSGGYAAHQRNSIDATYRLLRGMHAAGLTRLLLISSLSVIRPPRTPWERQNERTPRPSEPRSLGAYTWGKCKQEELVESAAASLGIKTRVVRPGALINWQEPELPGLMGRRLFGRWHLGIGRPALPIAICEVNRCAQAVGWYVSHFDDAPPVVNLFDPAIVTRGALIARLREQGWNGRVLWVPISVLAFGMTAARTLLSLASGRWPERLAAWSILRPRRYDARLTSTVFERADQASATRDTNTDVALSA